MDSPQPSKELFTVAGDVPDPAGTGLRGQAMGYDFRRSAAGHPKVFYRLGGKHGHPVVLELDVYALPGQPTIVHLLCPVCTAAGRTNMLTISSERKAIDYERVLEPPPFPGWTAEQMRAALPNGTADGRISIEAFACTWELTPEHRRQFGFNRCPWSVAIDKNVAIDV